jgi:hypothetical protein
MRPCRPALAALGAFAASGTRGAGLGVGVVVGTHEFVDAQVGVALGGGQTGMAQQFLDAAQVGAGFQQVGGEAVAQHVRVDALGQPGQGGELVEDAAGLAALHARPAYAQKQRLFGQAGGELATHAQVLGQALAPGFGERGQALLGALAMTRTTPEPGSKSSTSRSRASLMRRPEP